MSETTKKAKAWAEESEVAEVAGDEDAQRRGVTGERCSKKRKAWVESARGTKRAVGDRVRRTEKSLSCHSGLGFQA